jgi:hypothetical protein
MIWQKDNFRISSQKALANIDTIHDMLSRSWAKEKIEYQIFISG